MHRDKCSGIDTKTYYMDRNGIISVTCSVLVKLPICEKISYRNILCEKCFHMSMCNVLKYIYVKWVEIQYVLSLGKRIVILGYYAKCGNNGTMVAHHMCK